MFNPLRLANLHSATCFLNSLLREWNRYTVESSTFEKSLNIEKHFIIPLNHDRRILIPIKKYSILGRHQYLGKFYISANDKIEEISFQEMVNLLCEFLREYFKGEYAQIEVFKKRVFSSLNNIRDALEFRADAAHEFESCDFLFKDTEQALIIGHNFHPTPKSRDEFDAEDSLKYAPEFGGDFRLDWFMVDETVLHQQYAHSFHGHKWTEELFQADFAQTQTAQNLLSKGMIPVPTHPWQFKFLIKNSIVAKYIQDGRMVYIGSSQAGWSATSSLRSVYRDGSPYMLKFSMSLKLTNSIRNLLAREVVRGLQLRDVLSTKNGKKFLNEYPNFKIITEPAYFCLKDADGNLINESIVVCRENPFNGEAAQGKVMIATLTQDGPFGGDNRLQKLIMRMDSEGSIHDRSKNWFSSYLNIAIKPLFIAYANYGFILEAHQQNLILDIKKGFPVAAYFRDCQDTGYSELGYASFASEVPFITKDNGNVVNEMVGTRFFVYQVILNSTFNIITALAASEQITESELLLDLRKFLEEIRASGVHDPACLDYLLDELKLMHKGNFLYAFKSVNDNVIAKDPLAFYTPVQNYLYSTKTHYYRYFPIIQKTISLRTVDIAGDLECLHKWHNEPRVYHFWELNYPPEELRNYLEKYFKNPHQIPMIIEINGEPAGYSEIYWAVHDRIAHHYECEPYDRGFHLLIGEKKFLGIENTSAVFQSIMHFLYLDDIRTQRIVVEPRSDNERFIKYTKIIPSWHFIKEFDFPEKRAALIMSHREQFFREITL